MTHEHTIRVAAPGYAAHALVPAAVAAMSERHPDLDFEVITLRRFSNGNWDHTVDYDVGIVALPFERAGQSVLTLAQVEFVVMLPPGHRLAENKFVRPEDLTGENFVTVTWESQMRRSLDPFFARMQSSIHTRVTANTSAAACELVVRGLGVGVGDPLVAAAYVAGGLVIRRLALPLRYTLGAVFSADTAPSERIREFIDVTSAAATQLAPEFVR